MKLSYLAVNDLAPPFQRLPQQKTQARKRAKKFLKCRPCIQLPGARLLRESRESQKVNPSSRETLERLLRGQFSINGPCPNICIILLCERSSSEFRVDFLKGSGSSYFLSCSRSAIAGTDEPRASPGLTASRADRTSRCFCEIGIRGQNG